MTFTLTIDWLVYLYWLIEHYVFTYSLDLRVRSYYEYHERIAELNKDCSEAVVIQMPINRQESTEPNTQLHIEQSVLDVRAEELFSELQLELDNEETEIVEEQVIYSMVDFETEPEDEEIIYSYYTDSDVSDDIPGADYEIETESEDCINMDDLIESDCPAAPVGYSTFASARIADCIDGAQSWVVSVIGKEDSYIHVSDGKRIWVNMGDFASKLKNRDVVSIDVIRNGKEITVENVFLLETDASTEYSIPDEDFYYYQEDQIAI